MLTTLSSSFERAQVDMRMVIEGVIVNYLPTMQMRRQKLTHEIAPELPPVLGNARCLTRLVSNLVSNAASPRANEVSANNPTCYSVCGRGKPTCLPK